MRLFILSSLLLAAVPQLFAADSKPEPSSISSLVGRTLAGNPEIRFYEAEVAAA